MLGNPPPKKIKINHDSYSANHLAFVMFDNNPPESNKRGKMS